MTSPQRNALIVEDDELIALLLSDMLAEMGLRVCGVASTAAEAVALADKHRPDVVLMDVRLDGPEDGVDAAIEIHRRHPTPIIFVTGSSDRETIARIERDRATATLFKPIQAAQLRAALDKSLKPSG